MSKQLLTIKSIGALGDGISEEDVFVPGALPGEEVEAKVKNGRAFEISISSKSADRIEPPCPHFGDCGGCKVQHMSQPFYQNWKQDLVSDALRQAGIDAELAPIVGCAPHSRRRAVFSAVVTATGVEVGFQRAGSNHVVAIQECAVISERLQANLSVVGGLAQVFAPPGITVSLTVLDSRSGLDIAISGSIKLSDAHKRAISSFATTNKIARVTANGETIIENTRPIIELSNFTVGPPAGAFVQAVKSTEDAMVQLVTDHLVKCKRVADLFSGSGTFSLPLARASSVFAAENNDAALASLDRAWREAAGQRLKPITTEKRDLHNRPFMAKELDLLKIQGVVFDPPRAGAQLQSQELAKSKVKRIAAVSCNPTTLARDLRILIDGGYTLTLVTPLDQFLWSPHVEAVALLVRGKG